MILASLEVAKKKLVLPYALVRSKIILFLKKLNTSPRVWGAMILASLGIEKKDLSFLTLSSAAR